jgi:hypothetical protein
MSNISCTEFSRLLGEAVELRLPVDRPELRDHAADCTDCRAVWLDAVLLDGAVAQWRKTKKTLLSVDLADVVLFRRTAAEEAALSVAAGRFATPGAGDDRHVSSDAKSLLATARVPAVAAFSGPPRRWLSRRTAGLAAMVLASVVCVALLSGRGSLRQQNLDVVHGPLSSAPPQISPTIRTKPQISATGPIQPDRTKAAPAKPTAEAPVETMVQDAGSAYLDLASEAAQAVAGASVLVPRPDPTSATAPVVDANDRWVDDVGREFEPVSKNLSQAFQFLLEAVPADKAPAT